MSRGRGTCGSGVRYLANATSLIRTAPPTLKLASLPLQIRLLDGARLDLQQRG